MKKVITSGPGMDLCCLQTTVRFSCFKAHISWIIGKQVLLTLHHFLNILPQLVNNAVPGDMPHSVTFHLGLVNVYRACQCLQGLSMSTGFVNVALNRFSDLQFEWVYIVGWVAFIKNLKKNSTLFMM